MANPHLPRSGWYRPRRRALRWLANRCLVHSTLVASALLCSALVASIATSSALAQTQSPRLGPDQHLGVVTCAGSTCHGALRPSTDSSVLQTEFVTWHRQDKHARAYKVLLEERSRRIAANLGLEAAEQADLCLDCHADNVPVERRGSRFQIADGVGCEACHGGAERYLGPHLAGDAASRARLPDLGMYPTASPRARAELCLSCHLGSRDRLASHRLMGAGHPRMSFELDTFSDIQPAHYRADRDYRERKGAVNGARVWVLGQLAAAGRFLELFSVYQRQADGMFPELFFFDCHACHRSLREQRWRPRADTGLPPGTVRVNDAHLLMLRHLVGVLLPQQRPALDAAILALHKAATRNLAQSVAAAGRLADLVRAFEAELAGQDLDARRIRALMDSIVADGARGGFADYAAAEQAAMALGSMINALKSLDAINSARAGALNRALDPVYAALADDTRFDPAQLVTAMRAFQDEL